MHLFLWYAINFSMKLEILQGKGTNLILLFVNLNRYANELIEVYNNVIVYQVLVSVITICLMSFQAVVVRIFCSMFHLQESEICFMDGCSVYIYCSFDQSSWRKNLKGINMALLKDWENSGGRLLPIFLGIQKNYRCWNYRKVERYLIIKSFEDGRKKIRNS